MAAERPSAVEGLDVHETEDGLVIYTSVDDRVHHLITTAAVIFQLCDGEHDEPAIIAAVAELFALDKPPVDETRACLLDLEREGLIV